MRTVAELVRRIESLEEEETVSPGRATGVQSSSVATGEDMTGCLAAHTDYTMAVDHPEIRRVAVAEPHKAHFAADKERRARMGMGCAGPEAGHIDYTGSASCM